MSLPPDIVGLIVVFLGLIGSRFIYGRAIKALSDKEQESLAAVLVHLRWVAIFFYIFLFFSYFAFQKMGFIEDKGYFLYFIGVLILGLIGFTFYNSAKLKNAGLSSDFTQSYNISNAMRMIGIIGFIVIIYYSAP
jgi:hypothetical protein